MKRFRIGLLRLRFFPKLLFLRLRLMSCSFDNVDSFVYEDFSSQRYLEVHDISVEIVQFDGSEAENFFEYDGEHFNFLP